MRGDYWIAGGVVLYAITLLLIPKSHRRPSQTGYGVSARDICDAGVTLEAENAP
jgi:hypothetical protein